MREASDIQNIAVIGGGYVGRGVALQFAQANFRGSHVQPKLRERGARAF